ncbi:MAG TPA: NAD(+) synthase [Chloroflexota bacterium]|nr:NAD(+) synthase [Chloroflexota bacterium]
MPTSRHGDAAPFHKDVLTIDPAAMAERIVTHLRHSVLTVLGRKGGVVGLSGGIDSAVVLGLCVRAFGPERVVGLILPEKESCPESAVLAHKVAHLYGVTPIVEDITAALEGLGCYRRRDEAIRHIFPEYHSGYKAKISLPGDLLNRDALNLFSLTVISPEGIEQTKRLRLGEYLQIVAATNFKQRTRMSMLYYHAEARTYAVIGTANKNERDQGFFVKHGDGAIDADAIVHLYKTQVYQLAAYLRVPAEIQQRPPTTDTYSAPSTQEEFFFRLPFQTMDLLWYAQEHGVSPEEAARVMDLTPQQVERAYRDFEQKRRTTTYLRTTPLTL